MNKVLHNFHLLFLSGIYFKRSSHKPEIVYTGISFNIWKTMDGIYTSVTKEKYILLDYLFILKFPFIVTNPFPLNPKQFLSTSPQHLGQCLQVQLWS